jgi:hypothetical protein
MKSAVNSVTAALAKLALVLGFLLGGWAGLRHVVAHLSAYTTSCPKAGAVSACIGYIFGHDLTTPLLYVIGCAIGGLLVTALIVLPLRAVVTWAAP